MAGVGEEFEKFSDEAKKLPWWAWVVLAVVVFVVIQHFLSNQGQTTNAQQTANDAALADQTPGVSGDQNPTPPTGPTGPAQPVNPPVPAPPPAPSPAPKPKPSPHRTYTVVSGDTLTEIAGKEGVSEPSLYSANEGVIEATARQHGFPSSDNGHWIFPGEVLTIP